MLAACLVTSLFSVLLGLVLVAIFVVLPDESSVMCYSCAEHECNSTAINTCAGRFCEMIHTSSPSIQSYRYGCAKTCDVDQDRTWIHVEQAGEYQHEHDTANVDVGEDTISDINNKAMHGMYDDTEVGVQDQFFENMFRSDEAYDDSDIDGTNSDMMSDANFGISGDFNSKVNFGKSTGVYYPGVQRDSGSLSSRRGDILEETVDADWRAGVNDGSGDEQDHSPWISTKQDGDNDMVEKTFIRQAAGVTETRTCCNTDYCNQLDRTEPLQCYSCKNSTKKTCRTVEFCAAQQHKFCVMEEWWVSNTEQTVYRYGCSTTCHLLHNVDEAHETLIDTPNTENKELVTRRCCTAPLCNTTASLHGTSLCSYFVLLCVVVCFAVYNL